jgi:hypothetical protein
MGHGAPNRRSQLAFQKPAVLESNFRRQRVAGPAGELASKLSGIMRKDKAGEIAELIRSGRER